MGLISCKIMLVKAKQTGSVSCSEMTRHLKNIFSLWNILECIYKLLNKTQQYINE